MESEARRLLNEYRQTRKELDALELPTEKSIEEEANRLEERLKASAISKVGFLGESQVGKSSVINAILGEVLLPNGGVGPLTAQATEIKYGSIPVCAVVYHDKEQLRQARRLVQSGVENGEEAEVRASVLDFTKAQIRLLFSENGKTGNIDETHCARLLDAILDEKDPPADDRTFLAQRTRDIRKLFGTSETISLEDQERSTFRAKLRERAAGWRAPLIKSLRITIDLPILQHVEITDLPGIGVVCDAGMNEAERYIAKDADGVVVVVRNNGATESLLSLFERSGIIERFLWQENSRAKPLQLSLVVTYADVVARTRRAELVQRLGPGHPDIPSAAAIFQEVAEQQVRFMRQQLRDALLASIERIVRVTSTVERADGRKESEDRMQQIEKYKLALEKLCRELRIVCVNAPDYLGFVTNYTDDNFIRDDKQATNIHILHESLQSLATFASEARRSSIAMSFGNLRAHLKEALDLAENTLGNVDFLNGKLIDKLERILRENVTPFNEKLQAETNAFDESIQAVVRSKVEDLVRIAERGAKSEVEELTAQAEDLHWRTLNAALVRGGIFSGTTASLDYPGDIAHIFAVLIAQNLSEKVISPTEGEYKKLCQRMSSAFECFCDDVLQTELAGPVRNAILSFRERAQRIESQRLDWTDDETLSLAENVRNNLYDVVRVPIALECQNAVDASLNHGTGTKQRIIATFRSGCREAISVASESLFGSINDELSVLFKKMRDSIFETYAPLSAAFRQLLKTMQETESERLQQRSREILERVKKLRARLLGVASLPA
jgi:hypothetical protein